MDRMAVTLEIQKDIPVADSEVAEPPEVDELVEQLEGQGWTVTVLSVEPAETTEEKEPNMELDDQ